MMTSSGFKSNLAMTPSWTQLPSRVTNPIVAKASTRRTAVPPVRRSDHVIIYCAQLFGERR
jgi:hypothetical protein